MNHTLRRVAAAGALCLGLAAFSSSVLAQPPGAGAQGGGPREGMRERMFEDMKHRREQRLHDLLQIKPDQEAAFRTFLGSMEQLRPQRGPEAQGPAEPRALTTPERLDRMSQAMAERQQRFQRFAGAVKTFYGVLSPEQRKAFDALGPMVRGRMHGRMMGRGPMGPAMPMPGGPGGPPPR